MFPLMAKPWLLDQFAAAWWLKIILDALDKYGTARIPPILASRCPSFRRVHEILGLSLQPANQYGLREWSIRPGLESRLLDAGFDPKTREVVNTHKYQVACSRIDQQAKIKKERKPQKQIARSQLQAARAEPCPRPTEGLRCVSDSAQVDNGQKQSAEGDGCDPAFRLSPSYTDDQYFGPLGVRQG
jgi:hypothetical protein